MPNMSWKQASLVGLSALIPNTYAAAVVSRAEGPWSVAREPIQAVIAQDTEGAFSFDCQTGGKTVITASNIGFTTSHGDVGPKFQSCTALEQAEELVEYSVPGGRTTSRSVTYKTQSFQCSTENDQEIQLDIRVGNDGCAFRTQVPDGQYEVTAETSKWTFAQDGKTYLMDDPDSTSYEGEWIESDVLTGLADSGRVLMPYLAEAGATSKDQWVLLIEGDVNGRWSGSQFNHEAGSKDYSFYLAEDGVVKVENAVFTPWRIAVVGDLPTLFKSHFDQDNYPASNITDQSWIKPGNVAWHYIPEALAASNLTRMLEYVDLAVTESWPYMLIDEGWRSEDIPELVAYATERDVGILIWYNSNRWNDEASVAANIADMKAWGVKGTKIDFFLSDKQATHQQMDYILWQTAEAELMVNFHGAPPQRGRQREWPHYMTAEGIRGDEASTKSFRHTIIPVTRGLIGSMDFTPTLFTVASNPATDVPQEEQLRQCSVGCGLSRAIVFESSWQHASDRPEVIAEYPLAGRMYKAIPTAWQDSDLLPGSVPGLGMVVGRRSDALDRHYFGGVFNGPEQTFDFKPTNLPAGKTYILDVVHDAPGDDSDRTAIERTIHTDVSAESSVEIPVKSNGGFSAIACETAGEDGGCLSEL